MSHIHSVSNVKFEPVFCLHVPLSHKSLHCVNVKKDADTPFNQLHILGNSTEATRVKMFDKKEGGF